MQLIIKIDCDNAAFEDNDHEITSILVGIAKALDGCPVMPIKARTIFDSNGNDVGRYKIIED